MRAGDKTFYDTYWQAQSGLACDEKCRERFIVSEVKSFMRTSSKAAISLGSGLASRVGPGARSGREGEPARILDVGCGRGWLTYVLSRFGDVTGCDQSTVEARKRYPQLHFVECNVLDLERVFGAGTGGTGTEGAGTDGEAIKVARAKDSARIVAGIGTIDSGTPRAGNRPFDLAVCSEVIEHINKEDQPRLMAAISSILRPEGELILTTPNRPVAEATAEKLMLQHGFQPLENWLDAPGLRRIAEPYFDIAELGTVMFFPANIRRIGPLSRVYRTFYEVLGGYKVVDAILGGTLRGVYLVLVARKKRA